MWDRVKVIAKPTGDIISLAALKLRLRIDGDDEDDLLMSYLRGAVARIDGPDGIGYAMLEQTWRLTLDAFPHTITLPGAPIKRVAKISYLDASGVEQVLDAADYRVVADMEPARVMPATGKVWPATLHAVGAVKIDYVLGEAEAANVPADLVDAACLLVGHRYQNREAVGDNMSELPLSVEWLLKEYRRGAVA